MKDLLEVEWTAGQSFAKRHTVHELACDVRHPVHRSNIMDGDDIRMVQRTSGTHFPIEVRKTLVSTDPRFRYKFQRDISIEARVLSPIDCAHAAPADLAGDLIRPNAISRLQVMRC